VRRRLKNTLAILRRFLGLDFSFQLSEFQLFLVKRKEAGNRHRSSTRRVFTTLCEPMPEKNQIARILFTMRSGLHPPQHAWRRKGDGHAVHLAHDDIRRGLGIINPARERIKSTRISSPTRMTLYF